MLPKSDTKLSSINAEVGVNELERIKRKNRMRIWSGIGILWVYKPTGSASTPLMKSSCYRHLRFSRFHRVAT